MNEDDVLSFVRSSITSIWVLELLLLLYRAPNRDWSADELEHELAAPARVVHNAILALRSQALLTTNRGKVRFSLPDPGREEIVAELARLSRTNPLDVFIAIHDAGGRYRPPID